MMPKRRGAEAAVSAAATKMVSAALPWNKLAAMLSCIRNALTGLLSGAAALSLLFWGIGIEKINLVSVTESTREIGIAPGLISSGEDGMFADELK